MISRKMTEFNPDKDVTSLFSKNPSREKSLGNKDCCKTQITSTAPSQFVLHVRSGGVCAHKVGFQQMSNNA